MPTPIPRSRILQGPCQVQYNGSTFYSKGDVVVTLNEKGAPIKTDAIGLSDYVDDDFMAEITFQPNGQVTNTLLGILFPMSTAVLNPGDSVFPANDTPLLIWTRNGYKHTFPNAAVTKEPGFDAVSIKTPFNGNVTFTALRASATPWASVGSLVADSSGAYPGDAAFVRSEIITTPYTGRWLSTAVPTGTATATEASPAVFGDTGDGLAIGDTIFNSGYTNPALNGFFTVATTPTSGTYTLYQLGTTTAVNNTVGADSGTFVRANAWDGFSTEAGFTIATNVTLSDVTDDNVAVMDKRLVQLEVTCTAIPNGPKPSDVEAALGFQGAGATRGRSRVGTGAHLYLTGTGLFAKLPNAFLSSTTPIVGSTTKKRVGQLTWKSLVGVADGALTPPLILSTNSIA